VVTVALPRLLENLKSSVEQFREEMALVHPEAEKNWR
jgi:hypothetical protein